MVTLTVVVLIEVGVVAGLIGTAVLRSLCGIHRLLHTARLPMIVGRGAQKWVMRSPGISWHVVHGSPPMLRARPSGKLRLVPRKSPEFSRNGAADVPLSEGSMGTQRVDNGVVVEDL